MSFKHLGIAARLEDLKPGPHLALIPLCDAACEVCGIAWPGVPYIMRKTGMRDTAVRAALKELEHLGLVIAHGFETGGRGRAKEYLVLPGLTKLSTAPCGECEQRMQRYRGAMGMTKPGRRKVSHGDGFVHKPIGNRGVNPSESDTHPINIHNSITGGANAPPDAETASPLPSEPPRDPSPAKDALRQVNAMVRDSRAATQAQSPAAGTGDGKAKRSEGGTAPRMPESGTEVVKRED